MNNLSPTQNIIPPMCDAAIQKVRALEQAAMELPQTPIKISQVIHAGVYARTAHVPAGVAITGTLIKRATLLIIYGEVLVYTGDVIRRLIGYNVIAASANRKQAFVAITDTEITMLFATEAETTGEAEDEFTDEGYLLSSRSDPTTNQTLITGE